MGNRQNNIQDPQKTYDLLRIKLQKFEPLYTECLSQSDSDKAILLFRVSQKYKYEIRLNRKWSTVTLINDDVVESYINKIDFTIIKEMVSLLASILHKGFYKYCEVGYMDSPNITL